MNLAYKHLNAKLRIGEFTVGQWTAVLAGLGVMMLWGFYLSPVGAYLTIITSVYLGGLPITFALIAAYAEFRVVQFTLSAWRWGRAPGIYRPGPGTKASGYGITPDPHARRSSELLDSVHFDPARLWE